MSYAIKSAEEWEREIRAGKYKVHIEVGTAPFIRAIQADALRYAANFCDMAGYSLLHKIADGLEGKSHPICPTCTPRRPPSTGNSFRDAMMKNKGISTNQ